MDITSGVLNSNVSAGLIDYQALSNREYANRLLNITNSVGNSIHQLGDNILNPAENTNKSTSHIVDTYA